MSRNACRARASEISASAAFGVVERGFRSAPARDFAEVLDGQCRGQPPCRGVEFGSLEPDQWREVAGRGELPPAHWLVVFRDGSRRALDVTAALLDEPTELLKQRRFALGALLRCARDRDATAVTSPCACAFARTGCRVSAVCPRNDPSLSVVTGTCEPSSVGAVTRTRPDTMKVMCVGTSPMCWMISSAPYLPMSPAAGAADLQAQPQHRRNHGADRVLDEFWRAEVILVLVEVQFLAPRGVPHPSQERGI